jgi:hypothetical protein
MIPFHRFLIGTAILFCAGFAIWSIREFSTTSNTSQLVLGVSFALAAAGLAYYLKNLRRFLRRR